MVKVVVMRLAAWEKQGKNKKTVKFESRPIDRTLAPVLVDAAQRVYSRR